MVVQERQADLLEIIPAGRLPRGLAGSLHGRQEQADERADDRNHHQKLDESKTSCHPRGARRSSLKMLVHAPPLFRNVLIPFEY